MTEKESERSTLLDQIRPELITGHRKAHTLAKTVSIAGVGLHTGSEVQLSLVPAPVGTGVQFRRTDLPEQPLIPARLSAVCDTRRCTTIGDEPARVHTVEHVLSALSAYQIDNVIVEVSEAEPPAAGGCAEPFVNLIVEAGIAKQEEKIPQLKLDRPVFYTDGEIHLVALPSEQYRVSYTLDYPGVKALCSQYCSLAIESDSFKEELASCRTFALYEELSALMDAGLIKGGSLDSAVVIKGEQVLSKGGLRFENEMARHKVLDLVGDLALLGVDLIAHVVAIRSGHATNVLFARQILSHIIAEGKL